MEFLYETHLHTAEVSACAMSTASEQVMAYKKNGYTGIIVTDHFVNGNSTCTGGLLWADKMNMFMSGYLNARATGERQGVDVFFGWEYTIHGLDFLTYGLDIDFLLAHPGMDKLSIEAYSTLVRENGGYIAQAHPFRSAWYIDNAGPVDPRYLDGVEVQNAADSVESNGRALTFAEKNNLPVQGGSDSHNANHSMLLRYSGIALKKRADDIFDIINAIKNREVRIL